MIQKVTYPLHSLIINESVIQTYINKFWNEQYSKIIANKNNQHLMILFKVVYSENELGYRTIGHLRRVNFNDRVEYIEYLVERLGILNDSYTSITINKILITYILREGVASGTRALLSNLEDKTTVHHRFNNYNLPISMNPSDYGTILATANLGLVTRFIISSINKKIFQIDTSLDKLTNLVTLLGASDLKWTDTFVSEGCFKREIGKSTIYFLDGVEVLRKQQLPTKPFGVLQTEKHIKRSFVTMDIETIKKDNPIIPYLINAYNGTEHITSYANLTLSQDDLFKGFFNQLLTFFTKGNTLLVYAHNLSNFDGIFLLNKLISYGKLEPLY
jgi:hypothetical protein